MSNLSANNNKNDDITNFSLLARYIRYRRLSQSDHDRWISKVYDIDPFGVDENNKNLDHNNIIIENDYLNSHSKTIKSTIDEIEKLSFNKLKTDESLEKFRQTEFLNATAGKSFYVQVFHDIKNIEYQFALIEYALKNGQNPMDLFNINIDWMANKLQNNEITLNGRKITPQKKNNGNRLFCPKFYLKCELVFNLFCLCNDKNLFNLFSAKEMVRLFGSYSEDVFRFCYEKKLGSDKYNNVENQPVLTQLEKEFKSIGKQYGMLGGFFGFVFSFIFIAIIANIFAVSSPLILLIVVPGTFIGYAIGKIKKSNEYIEVLNLYDRKNKKNSSEQKTLPKQKTKKQQTFEAFKGEYQDFRPKPPGGSGINELNNQPKLGKADNLTENLDGDI